MVLLVDVDYNAFKSFLRADTAFFWMETTKAFILIKPLSDTTVRTIVMKNFKNPDETASWVLRELHRIGAVRVLNFTVDGTPMVEAFGTTPPTRGSIKLVREIENKVFVKEDEEESEKEKERKKKLELTSDKVRSPPDPRKVKQEKDPAVVEEERRKKEKPDKITESEEV